jgi:hypothetical protein
MATPTWHLGNNKSLERLCFLKLLHCSITGCRAGQIPEKKNARQQAAGHFQGA